MIVGSLFVWSFVTYLMGVAETFNQVFWLRALMGVSEALYIPAGLSLIADYHGEKSRSLAVGIHMTGLYTGQAIGGFGATVAAAFSWHTTFHWFGIVGIVYSLVLILFLKENPIHNVSSKKIDNVPGEKKPSIISGLSLLFTNWAFWIILFYFAAPSLPGWATKNWLPTLFADSLNIPMSEAGPISTITIAVSSFIGVILGGISGYFGGWVDQLIMRIVDIFNCIPTLPILLIASAVIDSWNVPADRRIYLLMAIITFFSWSGVARLVRGQILSLREQEYMTATEVMGIPTWRRIFVHLMPNVMPQLIVSMTLGLGSVILYESTLSYLGLGVQPPKAAWGTMISAAKETDILQNYMNLWLPAGIMIVIAVLGFNFVGDGLRDAMDPKARK